MSYLGGVLSWRRVDRLPCLVSAFRIMGPFLKNSGRVSDTRSILN